MRADFVTFRAFLPDKSLVLHSDGNGAAQVVAGAMHAALELSYEFSPLDAKGIGQWAQKDAQAIRTASDFASVIRSKKQAALEQQLSQFVSLPSAAPDANAESYKASKASPVEFAFSCCLNSLADPMFPPRRVAWSGPGGERSEVRLAANISGWMAVKKADAEKAGRREVMAACAGIFESCRRKLPHLLCGDAKIAEYESALDAFLSKFPERKSFSRLPEILESADREKIEDKLEAILGSPLARELFYYECFSRAGFTPFIQQETIGLVYPELKIPKPRGNFGKKKRK
ncbi:hypothetical protein HY995_04175 [Candidatus Micrarchaeota archaeon]|nr:hypothetical protein [Candidatus Micrarchaeota archaeon]